MIKFFRNIRRKLLSENRFSKYLIYALGEIILVVIGILIALQINNWNENRKDIKKSRVLLGEFILDLASDTTGINRVITLLERQISLEAWALSKVSYSRNQIDSVNKVFFSPYYQEFIQDRTFNKLRNSENPILSGFPNLQNDIVEYYTDTKFLLDYYNQQEERFFNEFNTAKVLRTELEIELMDFPMLASESQQFEILIDYAQTIEGRNFIKANYSRREGIVKYFNHVKAEAIQLIQLINTTLGRNE